MKKICCVTVCFLIMLSVAGQANYSGAYGYFFPPIGDAPANEKGASGMLVLLKMEGNKYRFWLDITIGWPS